MLRFIFNLLLAGLLLGLLIVTVIVVFVLPELPDIDSLRDVKMQVPMRIYTSDLSLIREFGEKRRTPVHIDTTPKQLINAFIAIEDNRFYQHPGVDWQGILRAAFNLIKTGKKTQGGSTITMQVARNFFLSREKTYLRKLNEILLSFKIENELSKNEILELYLNKIYFGQRAYGVGAAAEVYYGSSINNLTLAQSAMIAGLPKAPSTNNPISNPETAVQRRNLVLQRMLELGYISTKEYEQALATPITASLHSPDIEVEAPYVAEMVRKYLTGEYGEEAYDSGYTIITTIKDKYQTAANMALRKSLLGYDERHGYRGAESHYDLQPGDGEQHWRLLLDAFPTIGALFPAIIIEIREQSVTAYLTGIGLVEIEWDGLKWARKYINENQRGSEPDSARGFLQVGDIVRIVEDELGRWKLSQLPAVEGGLISLRPEDGATLALVGGFDFSRSKFNRITQSSRQPGSSFKPFIYSAALEYGHTAASIINDAPVVFDDPGIEDIWRPENYSGKNFGLTRLREALIRSRNLVSIRLLDKIGVSRALKHIANFGFDTEKLPHNLSLALGSGALSPWQLARGYSVLANGGFLIEPYYIERIETYDGEILFQADPLVACYHCDAAAFQSEAPENDLLTITVNTKNIINPAGPAITPDKSGEHSKPYAEKTIDSRNIAIMHSLTRDVIQNGTGRRARVLGRHDLSGKTGTTNNQRDAWFAGFNPSLVAISWVGFDNFEPLGESETGARAALPMWIDYMRIAMEDIPETMLERPPGMVTVRIDPKTGKLAPADQPDAMFEIFREEYAPTEVQEPIGKDIYLDDGDSRQIPEQVF